VPVLTEREVKEYYSLLNMEQKQFLDEHIRQTKKSKWLEALARKKGIKIDATVSLEELEREINDWVLVDVLDGGYGNRPYRCECGNSLRHQFIVHHKEKNETLKLGSTCFENYTDLPPEVVKDIQSGFHTVDLERDEILVKFKYKEVTNLQYYGSIEIPLLIQRQTEIKLPLTNRQLARLEKLKKEKELEEERLRAEKYQEYLLKKQQEEEEQRSQTFHSLTPDQRYFFDRLTKMEQLEMLNNIMNEVGYYSFEDTNDLNLPDDYIKQINLNLPLFHFQREYVQQLARVRYLKPEITNFDITYEELIERHLGTLKAIREKEGNIPSKVLVQEWVQIQQMVKDLKTGNPFDYKSFRILINNLIIPIRVTADKFL
jgi:hypothetical protein